jgi:hypothetical protein
MLTGRSPFASESAAESLGLVMMNEPEWNQLPATVPSSVVELLQRTLMKDPRQRLRDIGDAWHVITQPERPRVPPTDAAGSNNRRAVWVGVLGLVLAAAAATLAWWVRPSRELPLRRIELPASMAAGGSIVIAPDGTQVAYFAESRLFVRDLRDTTARDLGIVPPTADRIIWSPDSCST